VTNSDENYLIIIILLIVWDILLLSTGRRIGLGGRILRSDRLLKDVIEGRMEGRKHEGEEE